MIELNAKKIQKYRECAKKYFPKFFLSKKSFKGTVIYNEETLKQEYFEYLEQNFTSPFPAFKRYLILKGHNYIEELLEMSEKKGTVPGRLWEEYSNLNNMIATYVYGSIKKYDWGSEKKEHEVNEQILTQLALFEPLVYAIAMDIRNCIHWKTLYNHPGNENVEAKLDSLIDGIYSAGDTLRDSAKKYKIQQSILVINNCDDQIKKLFPELSQREVSLSELGKSRVKWHKARNNACSTLLHTVKELVDIDISVHLGISGYLDLEEKPQLDEIRQQRVNYYEECLNILKHSNNYFCYLNEEEKNKLAEDKKLRKQISRGIVIPTENT